MSKPTPVICFWCGCKVQPAKLRDHEADCFEQWRKEHRDRNCYGVSIGPGTLQKGTGGGRRVLRSHKPES